MSKTEGIPKTDQPEDLPITDFRKRVENKLKKLGYQPIDLDVFSEKYNKCIDRMIAYAQDPHDLHAVSVELSGHYVPPEHPVNIDQLIAFEDLIHGIGDTRDGINRLLQLLFETELASVSKSKRELIDKMEDVLVQFPVLRTTDAETFERFIMMLQPVLVQLIFEKWMRDSSIHETSFWGSEQPFTCIDVICVDILKSIFPTLQELSKKTTS